MMKLFAVVLTTLTFLVACEAAMSGLQIGADLNSGSSAYIGLKLPPRSIPRH